MNSDSPSHVLDTVLLESLKQLLLQTRKLQAKSGTIPEAYSETPLLTEMEFVDMLRSNPEEALSTDPPMFNYTPGFNPLLYLSERIAFLHPQRVNERREKRVQAQRRLALRCAHATVRWENFQVLRVLVRSRCAGAKIPLAFSVSSTCICLILSPLRLGRAVIAYSATSDFVETTYLDHDVKSLNAVKVMLNNLQPETSYFVRVHIQSPDEDVTDPPYFYVQKLITPIVSNRPCLMVGGRWMLGLLNLLMPALQPTVGNPSTLCVAGSIFSQAMAVTKETLRNELEDLLTRTQHEYANQVLQNICCADFAIAWNDTIPWSQLAIKEDERLLKKHAKELKKSRKGLIKNKNKNDEVPEIKFPDLPNTVHTLLQVSFEIQALDVICVLSAFHFHSVKAPVKPSE